MNQTIIILSGSILIILIVVITYYFTKKHAFSAGVQFGYEKRSNEQYKIIQKELLKHRESDDYKCNLENNYLKGKVDGAAEELCKFTIIYEPFVDIFENFFRKTVEAGYQMQILYQGLPIGDPTKRVTKYEEKYKEENVKYLVDQVNETVKSISQLGISKKIQVRTIDIPVKSSRKR